MRFVRLFIVALLALATSRLPFAVAAAFDDDGCAEACEGAIDGKHCPPNCDRGVCAKVHASLAAPNALIEMPAVALVGIINEERQSPMLSVVSGSLFRPPIA